MLARRLACAALLLHAGRAVLELLACYGAIGRDGHSMRRSDASDEIDRAMGLSYYTSCSPKWKTTVMKLKTGASQNI